KWPWQVGIVANNVLYCGGSIIAARWILTAADCLRNSHQMFVTYASVEADDRRKIVSIKNTTTPPAYTPTSWLNDIALFELEEPIHFDDTASPVCIPNDNATIPDYAKGVATGFGRTNDRNAGSPVYASTLQETSFPILPEEECG
ncbi:hypothetical protein PMAYCL1PPCAC_32365, partial [Pristionchus mayeri]